jgi:hypothetical protein
MNHEGEPMQIATDNTMECKGLYCQTTDQGDERSRPGRFFPLSESTAY